MRQIFLLTALFILIGCTPQLLSGSSAIPPKTDEKPIIFNSYKEMWQQVEQYRSKRLPKSALKVIESIYNHALKTKDHPRVIKALLYKFNYIQRVEEDTFVKVQKLMNDHLKTLPEPYQQLLHSMIAQQYWQYYRNNRWKFLNRSKTAGVKLNDMRTWSLAKVVEAVNQHYIASLKNPDLLKKISMERLDPVLYSYKSSRIFRPTLYDFLAHRAIDFYMGNESNLPKPSYAFVLNDPRYLGDLKTFTQFKIEAKDVESFQYKGIKLIQQLMISHLKNSDPVPLLDLNMKRLRLVYQKGIIPNKEQIFEGELKKLLKQFATSKEAVAEIQYELATLYSNRGDQYVPEHAEQFRWLKKEALTLCEKTIKTYPKTFGAEKCQNSLIPTIKRKHFQINTAKVATPGKPFTMLVKHKNIKKLNMQLHRVSINEYQEYRYRYHGLVKHFKGETPAFTHTLTLPDSGDFQNHQTEVMIPGLKPGKYVVILSDGKNFNTKKDAMGYSTLDVSNLAYTTRNFNRNHKIELFLYNRTTGKPVVNGTVQTYKNSYSRWKRRYVYEKQNRFKTDQNGMVTITKNSSNSFYLSVQKGDDTLFLDGNYYLSSYGYRDTEERTFFFTDRMIYRPGQTVYFKGIVLSHNKKHGEKTRLLTSRNKTITLYDANYQKVTSLNLKTNKYGTISGQFQIPANLLKGQFRITDGRYSHYFSVESYKRPKFEVTFPKHKKLFRLNDTITITGDAKAYAGFPIDQGKVVYRVTRSTYYPFRGYYWYYTPPSPSMEIARGVATTDEKGRFKVTFKALPDLSVAQKYNPAFHFTISADVTDLNGETRSASKRISIGYQSLKLGLSLKDAGGWHLNKEKKERTVLIHTTNLSGNSVPTTGTITLTPLVAPDRVMKKRLWKKPDQRIFEKTAFMKRFPDGIYNDEDQYRNWKKGKPLFTRKFDTGKTKEFALKTADLKPGVYLFTLKGRDDQQKMVEKIHYFTVYDPKSKKLFRPLPGNLTVVKGSGEPGENAQFLVGSSYKNQYVFYEVEHREKIVARKRLNLNSEQKLITLPIKKSYRGNVTIYITMVRNNRIYQYQHTVQVPWSNKKLKLAFETFRDHLQPGEKEQWRIKLKGPDGERVAAEMVATLYDASLDLFRANSWYFSIFPSLYGTKYPYAKGFGMAYSQSIGYFGRYSSGSKRVYDRLNWFGFYWRGYVVRYGKGKRNRQALMDFAAAPTSTVAPVVALEEAEKSADSFADLKKDKVKVSSGKKSNMIPEKKVALNQPRQEPEAPREDQSKQKNLNQVKARTNFNETAFFLPHLTTNQNGVVTVNFTIPESLTKWKMMGLAHTEDLKSGLIFNELVTKKNLMVLPNAPRFLREGDTIDFTSKVTNLTPKALNGQIKLMLFDAITMKPVDHLFGLKDGTQTFKTKKSRSTLITWRLSVPETVDAVTYRIVATGGNFSDGEEKTLPVLKNRMMVTETMPLPVRSLETKSFNFKKLIDSNSSKTLKHHKLTLEFTANPVWYAVQAIPYMMEYPYECMEQTFTRYYGNALGNHIIDKMPKIKKVFERWQNDPKQKNALKSNLEKNEELKSLLLEETPWVQDGLSESAQKKRIALLFDLHKLSQNLDSALRKLKRGQLSSGGWPWFQGGRENRYITQHIVTGFAHLQHLGVSYKNKVINNMVSKAIPYLDHHLSRDYQRLLDYKVDLNKNNLSQIHLHYFYARSYYKDRYPLDPALKKYFNYYFKQIKTYWKDYNRYSQGLIALSLYRYGEKEVAKKIMASIKEHAIHSEEMGTYWKEQYGYFWYQAPIESQALLIEAFDEITEDQKMVEGMKTWLLKSKQTQNWKTTKATTDAVYALLLRGENLLKESKSPIIKMGTLTIDPDKMKDLNVETGTGYFKTSWSKESIKPEMGKITVQNRNKVVAWGAVYWQYFEQLDKITSAETPLKLKKQLFVERHTDRGPVLYPLKKQKVKVGDRIKVRIELRVDRDMEYIHMKDMRASSFEPENVISRYKWQDGLGYYESTGDGSTSFFIDYLPKGTYIFEYPLRATHTGDFSNGITTIQSMYAPEFSSHSEGVRVEIKR